MSFTAPDPVVSGRAYRVTSVSGSVPSSIEQFMEADSFTISMDGTETDVHGQGSENNDGVRFHEKSLQPPAKDVRVWQIDGRDDVFTATATAAF
jgi:hypothetical protein